MFPRLYCFIRPIWLTLVMLFTLILSFQSKAQKVGVVLSGGGADGIAHVGVLKALEENEIPIDFISGTSIGAFIGSLYASGYSITEIETYFTSREFVMLSTGALLENQRYFYHYDNFDPSMGRIQFNIDSIFNPKIPTNLISSEGMDYKLMELLAASGAAANNNFDSLMIPFRCIASDIYSKKQVIFDKGNLSEAVRASMTYPFYLRPIRINGKLLFDGGLYNNFPADVLCDEFKPDYIIGSTVATSNPEPDENDVVNQLRNLLMSQTNYKIDCTNGWLINPNVDFGVFSFDQAQAAIDSGYNATVAQIETIRQKLSVRRKKEDITKKRAEFKLKKKPLSYSHIIVSGTNKRETYYIGRKMTQGIKLDTALDNEKIKRNYFRLSASPLIQDIFPKADFDKKTNQFHINLKIRKPNDFTFKAGGNVASRPVSHGFVGLDYLHLSKVSTLIKTKFNFGKFNSSFLANIRIDFPTKIPFYTKIETSIQRRNYFESRYGTLFTENRPSYVITRDNYFALNFGFPIGNAWRVKNNNQYFTTVDEYYQTRNFSPSDTSDITRFEGYSTGIEIERNTLNYKVFPTEGKRLKLSMKFVNGDEKYKAGSTSKSTQNEMHNDMWFQAKLTFDNYFFKKNKIKLGCMLEGAYSTQNFRSNYSATIIRATSFEPLPESQTLFLESFRSYKYAATGIKLIFQFTPNWFWRNEGYIFQPFEEILLNPTTSKIEVSDILSNRYFIANTKIVYQSPIGPVSLGASYYQNQPSISKEEDTPISFFFNLGYLLFPKRPLD